MKTGEPGVIRREVRHGMGMFIAASVILLTSVASGDIHQYLARDFFKDAPLGCISAEESITQLEKDLIIQSKFALSDEPLSPFSVISVAPHRLRLRDVDIHVYVEYPRGGWIVSVTSILGNHDQNHNTVFYFVNESGEIEGEIRAELLGIGQVFRNDLLDEADHFPEGQNCQVPLNIMECGSLIAVPWTWMNPEWSNRKIVNRVIYVWTGSLFDRVSVRISDGEVSP